MAPLMVPQGVAVADVAARLFQNFRELAGLFTRWRMDEALRRQTIINRARYARNFNEGDIVASRGARYKPRFGNDVWRLQIDN